MRTGILAILSLLCVSSAQVSSQEIWQLDYYDNEVLADYIASVEFQHEAVRLSLPIIDLGKPGRLRLDFDDTEGGFKNYTYRLVHCNKDWQPSALDETEYLDGFNGEELPGFGYSSNKYSEYTHYDLTLPNDDVTWMISGNYALVIIDDDLELPVLIRRFVVAEESVQTFAEMIRPRKTSKRTSHHEINMRVKYDKIRINRPAQEIYATVLQNGNWETAQYNIQSTYDRSNTLYYDFVDLISFPAKKEFRNFDIRSLASRSEFVHSIERNDFETNVLLTLSRPRFEKYYMTEFDANGQFIIDNREFAQADVSSEYAKVNFALFSSSEYEEDVYIVGAFSDWKAKDKYKLSYDSAESMYTTTVDFKQGFYDYMYGVLDENGQIDTSPFEGNWHETENDYHIIIYFRDFGGEYDRVVDVLTISSGTN